MIPNGSPLDDPAVGAGFAAAYGDDPWQGSGRSTSARSASGAEQVPMVAEGPLEAGPVEAAAARAVPRQVTHPRRAGLVRPLAGAGRSSARRGRSSAARAVSGAAVAVGGVLLGISSLLWITGEPPRAEPVGTTAAPPAQSESAEVEAVPPDSPPLAIEPLDVPPPPAAEAPAADPPAAPPPVALPPVALPPVAVAAPPLAPLTVLNNSRATGLADRAASGFRKGGWPVAETGNFTGRIRATTVYYAAGQEEAARAFARRFARVERVLPRFDGLPGSGLTVVLTSDYA